MKLVICNKYHSGNRKLAYERKSDVYQCQGCGAFYAGQVVRERKNGSVSSYDGSGGCVRVK